MLTVEEAKDIMDALQAAGHELQRIAELCHQLQRFTELFAQDPELAEDAERAEVLVAGAFGMMEDALHSSGN